jgi:hypothetical protein
MKNKSKLCFEFVVLVTSLFLISSRCVGSSPKVLVSSSYEASGLALLSNPVLMQVHADATNVGDVDAKNVECVVQITYNGKIVEEQTVYFGTVKVGSPVRKDTIINVNIPANDWQNFNKNPLDLKIGKIIIDGTETTPTT